MDAMTTLILAGGRGSRMASGRNALLHEICGIPMLRLTLRAASDAGVGEIAVVVGQDGDTVRQALEGLVHRFVLQPEPLGTVNAVLAARELLSDAGGSVLVLPGNLPRISGAALRRLAEQHVACSAATTILTAGSSDCSGYDRLILSNDGCLAVSAPTISAKAEPVDPAEIDSTCCCFRIRDLLESIHDIEGASTLVPFGLADIVRHQVSAGLLVCALPHGEPGGLLSVTGRCELAQAAESFRREKNLRLMGEGVTFVDPGRTYVELDVEVARDVVLYPGVELEGNTRIGEGCVIRSSSRITNSTIGRNVEVLESCVISDSEVAPGTTIGPFARLRDHSVVGERCRVGNFVELKKTSLGADSTAAHHAYLGDATVGAGVNIGAGVITCNYDGVRKNITVIEDGAFIGTDSQLVAPITVGRGAYVAAGSCITQDVPAGSLAVARSRQTVKEGWADRRREATQKG